TSAARNAGAPAAASGRRAPEAGFHAAVRAVDARRARAGRARRAAVPRRSWLDRARRARARVAGVDVGRGALEPALGPRDSRPLSRRSSPVTTTASACTQPLGHVVDIGPSSGLHALNAGELWRYRELLYFLAWRDVKVRYKQTVLGAAWAILQPLLTMA